MGSMIRSAPLTVFLVMVAVSLLMAGVVVFVGLRARRRAALVKATPKSYLGMAEDGYRQFEGSTEALDGKPESSALTKAPCVWFHAKVEEWARTQQSGGKRTDWRVVKEVTSDAPFLLRDATGACVVYPADAEVTPTDKSLWYGATIDPVDTAPAKVGPAESAKSMIEVAGGPNSKYRYSEERIYAGNPLVVLGAFESGLAVAEQIVVDGEVIDAEDPDQQEEAIRAAAGTKASLRRGPDDKPFIMTTLPRDEHVEKMALGGTAALGIAVLPLAVAALIVWARFS